jgi:crotonobetainyl-CoA:carnitine CoA-transferase CaiB-like acyl-CoA transferase
MKASGSELPLDGLRVLDLTRLIPGAVCTSILGDAGAEVIKVEEPITGDYERQIHPFTGSVASRFLLLNRNKKSLAVNLKREEGRRCFLRIADSSDVLVESFRPGTTTKLGIDYASLAERNPRLIYCSISAFGQDGPYRDVVAHDINILGMTGILDITGTKEGPPAIPGIQIADSVAGMYAAMGILLSVIGRGKDETGRYIDISMFDCAMGLIFDAARYHFAGAKVPARGSGRLWGGFPNYAIYETKDGKYITIGSLESKFKKILLRKLYREDLLDGEDEATSTRPASSDMELHHFFQKTFLSRTRDEWVREFSDENICIGPVNSIEEALINPAAIYRKMIMDLVHPSVGKYKQIGTPLKSTRVLANPDRLPAPRLGEHTRELLVEKGYSKREIDSLVGTGVILGNP